MDTKLQDSEYNFRIKYSGHYPIIKITDFAYDAKRVSKKIFTAKYKDWQHVKRVAINT